MKRPTHRAPRAFHTLVMLRCHPSDAKCIAFSVLPPYGDEGTLPSMSKRVFSHCYHDSGHTKRCIHHHTEETSVNEGPNALLLAVIGVAIIHEVFLFESNHISIHILN